MNKLTICEQLRDPASVMQVADHAADVIEGMHAVVSELIESARYWCEYDVPIGIVDRLNAAIARAEGRSP